MSVHNATLSATVLVPPRRPEPPGARLLADAVAWLFARRRGSSGLSRWLATGRARAEASRAARRQAHTRRQLIALARRYEASQPSFAKDLLAAASSERR